MGTSMFSDASMHGNNSTRRIFGRLNMRRARGGGVQAPRYLWLVTACRAWFLCLFCCSFCVAQRMHSCCWATNYQGGPWLQCPSLGYCNVYWVNLRWLQCISGQPKVDESGSAYVIQMSYIALTSLDNTQHVMKVSTLSPEPCGNLIKQRLSALWTLLNHEWYHQSCGVKLRKTDMYKITVVRVILRQDSSFSERAWHIGLAQTQKKYLHKQLMYLNGLIISQVGGY